MPQWIKLLYSVDILFILGDVLILIPYLRLACNFSKLAVITAVTICIKYNRGDEIQYLW